MEKRTNALMDGWQCCTLNNLGTYLSFFSCSHDDNCCLSCFLLKMWFTRFGFVMLQSKILHTLSLTYTWELHHSTAGRVYYIHIFLSPLQHNEVLSYRCRHVASEKVQFGISVHCTATAYGCSQFIISL